MKKNSLVLFSFLAMAATFLSSCQVIGGIFKAGFWTAIIVVALIVAIVIFVINKMSSKNKD